MLFRTFKYGIITLFIFVCVDILEIKIRNLSPRYDILVASTSGIIYFQTPFYDLYSCNKNALDLDTVVREYKIALKKFKMATTDDLKLKLTQSLWLKTMDSSPKI